MANLAHTLQRSTVKDGTAEKIMLSDLQTYRIHNRRGQAVHIQGVKGVVYVTAPNNPEDYMLHPGEQVVINQRGLVLVQGMPEGAFRYSQM